MPKPFASRIAASQPTSTVTIATTASRRRHPRQHQHAADLLPDRRQHFQFAAGVLVRQPVLHVDHAHHPVARDHRSRKKRLKVIFFQFAEFLEPRILIRLARDPHQPPLPRYPSGQAFIPAHPQFPDGGRVRRIRRAQHQIVAVLQVDQARIALRELHHQRNHPLQYILQAQVPDHEAADLLK